MKHFIMTLMLLGSFSVLAADNSKVICHAEEDGPDTVLTFNFPTASSIKAKVKIYGKQTYEVPSASRLQSNGDRRIDMAIFHTEMSTLLPARIFDAENRNKPMNIMLNNGSVELQPMVCTGKH